MVSASILKCYGCEFESLVGRALKERQCMLEGQARYVNVQGSVHWGCKIFSIDY